MTSEQTMPTGPEAPQTQTPDMSIVLVCWNNLDYLEPCLESLCLKIRFKSTRGVQGTS